MNWPVPMDGGGKLLVLWTALAVGIPSWEQRTTALDKNRREYAAMKSVLDNRISKLPPEFQGRIEWFRDGVADWGPNFEGYELFCCEQAALLLERFKTAEEIVAFQKWPHDKQAEVLPDISEHSGNTFSCACGLAKLYLHDKALIPKAHGAMCALVGCDEYGCYASRKRK